MLLITNLLCYTHAHTHTHTHTDVCWQCVPYYLQTTFSTAYTHTHTWTGVRIVSHITHNRHSPLHGRLSTPRINQHCILFCEFDFLSLANNISKAWDTGKFPDYLLQHSLIYHSLIYYLLFLSRTRINQHCTFIPFENSGFPPGFSHLPLPLYFEFSAAVGLHCGSRKAVIWFWIEICIKCVVCFWRVIRFERVIISVIC